MVCLRLRHVGCNFFMIFLVFVLDTANIEANDWSSTMTRYICIPNEVNGKLLVFEQKNRRVLAYMKTFGDNTHMIVWVLEWKIPISIQNGYFCARKYFLCPSEFWDEVATALLATSLVILILEEVGREWSRVPQCVISPRTKPTHNFIGRFALYVARSISPVSVCSQ